MATYRIKSGDSLSAIAKRFGTTVKGLQALNRIADKDVNLIFAGNDLKIPDRLGDVERIKETVTERVAPRRVPRKINLMRTSAVRKPPPAAERTAPVNPRLRATRSRSEGTPTESKGLMARSRKRSEKNPSLLSSAPARAYAAGMLSSGVLTEDFFRPDEFGTLTNLVVGKVKKGSNNMFYGDYDEEAGSKINYEMEIPSDISTNLKKALKFTTGRMDIVQHKGRVLGADEFDFEGKEKISEQSLIDQVKFLADRTGAFLKGDIGLYGTAHSFGEVFNPPGEGPSFRIDFGSPEDLGIDQEVFKNLPTLESYEKENAYRIKQRPLRDFFRSLGVIDV